MNEPTGDRFGGVPDEGSFATRITDEIMERLERGESVDIEKYAQLYPKWADYLRGVIPFLKAMCNPETPADERLLDEPSKVVPGQLGDFQIHHEIGRGSMGVVYQATQLSLNRPVALKVLPYAAMLDPNRLQRFKNEAQAAAQMHHPNIVPVHFVGCERSVHFYAMQLIEGRSLAEIIDELRGDVTIGAAAETVDHMPTGAHKPTGAGSTARERGNRRTKTQRASTPLSSDGSHEGKPYFMAVSRLGVQAAQALDHAHATGVLHRDVKPSNMLVDAGGHLWVSDFGLARINDGEDLTLSGDVLGTLAYMSPEAARGRSSEVDRRSDIYSLGASLYQLLTLRPLFDVTDRGSLLDKIVKEEPTPLRRHKPSIPVDLETIVLKAISKDQTDRYSTAGEMAKDLERFIEEKPIQARRPSLMDRSLKWSRRHRTLVASVAIILLLTAIGSTVASLLLFRAQNETAVARDQADANYQIARQAVDEMYTKVATLWLTDQPRLTELERDFLEKAAVFYEQMADDAPTDYRARLDSATATFRAGNIHYKLGRLKKAESGLRSAVEALSQLAKEDPKNVQACETLALAEQTLGRLLKDAGQTDDARVQIERAIREWENSARNGADGTCAAGRIRAELNLAALYQQMGQFDTAQGHLTKSRDEAKELLENTPESLELRRILCTAFQSMAALANNRGEPEHVAALLDEARIHLDYCLKSAPNHRGFREANWFQRLIAANAQVRLGKLPDAERLYRENTRVSETLREDFPLVPDYRDFLAENLLRLASVLYHTGRQQESRKRAEEAKVILDDLCREYPKAIDHHFHLAEVHTQLAKLDMTRGAVTDAVEHFEKACERQRTLANDGQIAAEHRISFATTLKEYAWIRATCKDERIQDVFAAEQLATEAVSFHPNDNGAHLVVAIACYRQGKFEDALIAAEVAAATPSEFEDIARFYRAMSLARLGRSSEAKSEYDKAIRIFKKSQRPDDLRKALAEEARTVIEMSTSSSKKE